MEAVTVPVRGRDLVQALDYYERKASNYDQHFTYRCSTHVHVNMLDYTPQQIAVAMYLTLATDNYLYAAGVRDRSANYNCRPASLVAVDVERLAIAAYTLIYGKVRPALIKLNEKFRYQGINWCALTKHGTMEFRHFPGEYRAKPILRWVSIAQRIAKMAQTIAYEDMVELCAGNCQQFGFTVFGHEWDSLQYDGHTEDWSQTREILGMFDSTFSDRQKLSFDYNLRLNGFFGGLK